MRNVDAELEDLWDFARQCPQLKTLRVTLRKPGINFGRGDRDTPHRFITIDEDFLNLEIYEAKLRKDNKYISVGFTKKVQEEAMGWLDHFAGHAKEFFEGKVDTFLVSMFCKDIDNLELVHLVPTKPEHYGVTFYGYKRMNSEDSHWVRIEELCSDVPCYPDGTLGCLYDGVSELFESEE